jgi:hypothetical protein
VGAGTVRPTFSMHGSIGSRADAAPRIHDCQPNTIDLHFGWIDEPRALRGRGTELLHSGNALRCHNLCISTRSVSGGRRGFTPLTAALARATSPANIADLGADPT